jgi:hypothetical protein
MDETRIETILQNMGSLLLKVSEATETLLEHTVGNLIPSAVADQRDKAQAIRQSAASVREMLRLLGSNQ